jgi:hypothetical protein
MRENVITPNLNDSDVGNKDVELQKLVKAK